MPCDKGELFFKLAGTLAESAPDLGDKISSQCWFCHP